MRPVFALATLMLLAGCASPAPAVAPDASRPAPAGPAEFDDQTGAIEGLVHDDALQPLEGVEVGIAGLPSVFTDETGRYALSYVPPGEHAVFAQKTGYNQTARRVSVPVGDTARLDIQLTLLPADGPWQQTLIRQGFIPCSVVWRPRVVLSGFSGGCPTLQGEDIITRATMLAPLPEIATVVGETAWRSNQALGAGLMMGWGVATRDDSCGAGLGFVQGRSPLRLSWAGPALAQARDNLTKSCAVADPCQAPKDCDFTSIGFSSPDTLGASSSADIGITLNQQFTTYVTQFRLEPAPANFTALPDG